MRPIVPVMVFAALTLSACVYRPDIKQGNFLKPGMIAQVKPGMTEAQVRFVLGPPMIRDPFHPDRWDYVYYNLPASRAANQSVSREHVLVQFKDGKVVGVEQVAIPPPASG
ncbi:MAG: outer membrane protein assembly factor BamE [Gammaproteobacteria bacterium]|nr:outer membrane protein assembly factor BamE [Gammaproteobacteria bacterium]MBU6508613.1 outer membrane protein assembly factor BamE [Gammaproteobacteria bacterium]MDE1983100.1 outer membrane protein assembly factor BamE [Gammaproteobacteria bacterium]MDE2107589.1 outer membrane protein assembly factor BamE [Gammaproteobacteria bacterium]MDE2460675.1 outer membrane protein assembly factor BamE [Gammaproteobacteria bacterium]